MNIWMIKQLGKKKSQNKDMKELLGQRAEWRKSHHVSLNRDLILQSPQSEWNKEVQATAFRKRKQSMQTKDSCSQPWNASFHQKPTWLSTGGTEEKWLSVKAGPTAPATWPWLPPRILQESSPIPRDFVSWDTQVSESYQQAGKHTVFPWKAEDGGQRSIVKKGREFASLRF